MKDLPLTAPQQDQFRQELDRMWGPLDPVPSRDRLMPTADQLAGRSVGLSRRPWHRIAHRWLWGMGAALALMIGVSFTLRPSSASMSPSGRPHPGIQDIVFPTWSAHMTSRLQHGRVSFTFAMANVRKHPVAVKPWTHPFRLVLTPEDGGKRITRVEHAPRRLTIPVHQSRRLTVTMPAPPPGWYFVLTSTVGSRVAGQGWTRGNLDGVWFSPYRMGTTRTGTIVLNRAVTLDGYTIIAQRLRMTTQETVFTFVVDTGSRVALNVTGRITADGHRLGGWGAALNRLGSTHFTASLMANPLLKIAKTVTVTISALDTASAGRQQMAPGPWVFRIALPRSTTP